MKKFIAATLVAALTVVVLGTHLPWFHLQYSNGHLYRLIYPTSPRAQNFQAQPLGLAAYGANFAAFTPTLGSNAGAVSVTNPASNGIINVEAGQVFCFQGALDGVGRTQVNLVLPSSGTTTYLVVYNCVQNAVYAKLPVTGPGTVTGPGGVGIPAQLLAPVFGVEVPLATVVCNSTSCGNSGGTSSITDARPSANFSNSHLTQAGNAASNKDTVGAATLASGTVTVTFNNAYATAPICVVTWNGSGTFTTGASLKCVTTTTTAVITSSTGTDTAVVNYWIAGNPN